MEPTTPSPRFRTHRRSPHQPFHQSTHHDTLTTAPLFGPLSVEDPLGGNMNATTFNYVFQGADYTVPPTEGDAQVASVGPTAASNPLPTINEAAESESAEATTPNVVAGPSAVQGPTQLNLLQHARRPSGHQYAGRGSPPNDPPTPSASPIPVVTNTHRSPVTTTSGSTTPRQRQRTTSTTGSPISRQPHSTMQTQASMMHRPEPVANTPPQPGNPNLPRLLSTTTSSPRALLSHTRANLALAQQCVEAAKANYVVFKELKENAGSLVAVGYSELALNRFERAVEGVVEAKGKLRESVEASVRVGRDEQYLVWYIEQQRRRAVQEAQRAQQYTLPTTTYVPPQPQPQHTEYQTLPATTYVPPQAQTQHAEQYTLPATTYVPPQPQAQQAVNYDNYERRHEGEVVDENTVGLAL